jgi:hypothetical protein
LRRQATERFIQNQYFRLHGECAGNDYPLGFPAGKGAGMAMRRRLAFRQRQRFINTRIISVFAEAEIFRAKRDFFLHAESTT